MAKRTSAFELSLTPPRDDNTPAYRWLYRSLRAEILRGRLRPGMRLPATRDLAAQYHLSRGTVVHAFEQLKSEGYLTGTTGSGTYISLVLPDDLLRVPRASESHEASNLSPPRPASDFSRKLRPFAMLDARPSRAFRANLPALDLFPADVWAHVSNRRLRRASMNLFLGCEALGYRPLRAAIADYLVSSRGVKCAPEQVVIVSGVQEALDLTARLFLNPGDKVFMEDPGYIGASILFEATGARVCPVPLDEQGLILDARKLRGARLVYITPGHQFPLGISMSLSRRLELLDWARRSRALIFEDDYDSEYRYSGRPLPALQGLDRHDSVLFAGSFSKVLFPSLRLGYLVVPSDLIDSFSAIKSVTSRHTSLLDQAILCDFIAAGHFARHIRRMRQIYAERLTVLLEEARRHLSGLLEVSPIEAGLQTVGWLQRGITAKQAVAAAKTRNIEVANLKNYARGVINGEGLQLGFAAVDEKELRRGVRDLAIALEYEARTSHS